MPTPQQIVDSAIKAHVKKWHRKKFVPPMVEEVQEYIDKNGYNVNAAEFIRYYADGEPPWHDQSGKPVRSWKQKLVAVWAKMPKAKRCSTWNCRKMGVYTGTDDTGVVFWKCEDHKPKRKPFPKDIPVPKVRTVEDKKESVSDKVNRQRRALGVNDGRM